MRQKFFIALLTLFAVTLFIATGWAAWSFNNAEATATAVTNTVLEWQFITGPTTGTVIEVAPDGTVTIDGQTAEVVVNSEGESYNYGDVTIKIEADENGNFVLTEFTTSNESFALFGSTIYLPTSVEIDGEVYPVTGISEPLDIDLSDPLIGTSWYANHIHIPDGYTYICDSAFAAVTKRTTFHIPTTVTSIGANAFKPDNRVTQTIAYSGTQAQWNSISKAANWENGAGSITVSYNS